MQKIKSFLKQFSRHWITAFSAWTSKIIVSLIQIISIRELLLYLGEERYSVYIIAFSLTAWLPLAELSVGTSLQNYISQHRAQNKNYDRHVVSAFQIEIFTFLFFAIVIFFLSPFVQNLLFRKFALAAEIKNMPIVLTVCLVSLIFICSSIIHKIYYAVHKGYISNILPALSSIISMILIVIFRKYHIGGQNIIYALLIFLLPQAIVSFTFFAAYFRRYISKLFTFDFTSIKDILVRAFKLHGVGIFTTIYIQTDYLVISQTLAGNPNEIISYSIFTRVFFFFSFIYSSFLASVWPVISEMYHQGQLKEIWKMLKRYLLYGFILMTAGTVGVMIFSKMIFHILAPGVDIINAHLLILILGFYMIIKTWNDTFHVFLQSVNVLRIFWIFMPFEIIINAAAQYFFSKQFGIYGIIFGLIISVLATSFWILPIKARKVFS
ncbi:MAG: MATE family efflux transporter [Elusimicrobiota bacterium]|jgi:O-antigen/teichoic acid export membrane protein|nr:MATE family efflux transporter [Elusimicrobiota bacterium]